MNGYYFFFDSLCSFSYRHRYGNPNGVCIFEAFEGEDDWSVGWIRKWWLLKANESNLINCGFSRRQQQQCRWKSIKNIFKKKICLLWWFGPLEISPFAVSVIHREMIEQLSLGRAALKLFQFDRIRLVNRSDRPTCTAANPANTQPVRQSDSQTISKRLKSNEKYRCCDIRWLCICSN